MMCLRIFLILSFNLFFIHCTFASSSNETDNHIENIALSKNTASIQGFQRTRSALKFIDAHIYISYINDKATFSNAADWNKTYTIPTGPTKIRYISDTQMAFFSGEISFEASPGQRYQIKNNQSDRNNIKNAIHFWIENLETGEIVNSQQSTKTLGTAIQNPYVSPIIIKK